MTRKQHLQKLPLQKRLQAMENIRRDSNIGFVKTLSSEIEPYMVIYAGFDMFGSRQGFSYWDKIHNKYFVL